MRGDSSVDGIWADEAWNPAGQVEVAYDLVYYSGSDNCLTWFFGE